MGHKQLVSEDRSQAYPDFLKLLKSSKLLANIGEPLLFELSDEEGLRRLEKLANENPDIEIVDNYDEQYAELLLSRNAHLYRANYEVQKASIKKLLDDHYGNRETWKLGAWVYYPWKK